MSDRAPGGHQDWITPGWAAPPRVRAVMTARAGGVSAAPFDSFNLGSRCGDDPAAVARNRAALRALLPAEPAWLKQVHGAVVADAAHVPAHVLADIPAPRDEPEADASVARTPGAVCAILVADCMPVLLCNRAGTVIGAAHAGWRGLSGGVIEATVAAMQVPADEIIAWLGPAIGPDRFEVGAEVRAAFVQADAAAGTAFRPYPGRPEKFLCDLYALARQRLAAIGVTEVSGGGYCTVSEARFFSYRRDKTTGRMGAFLWIEAPV